MAIAVTARGSIASGTDATSYATAAFTPTASKLLIGIFNVVRSGSADPSTPTVSGQDGGDAWQLITNHFWDTIGTERSRMCLFACITGASPGSAAVTCSLGGVTHTSGTGSVFEVSGADESHGLAQTIVQTVVSAPDVAAATSGSLALAAEGHADNRPFSGWAHQTGDFKTPRASWTEIHDALHGPTFPTTGLETQWRSDAFETTASASWSASVLWGGIAFEIKALAVPASLLLRPNPMRHMLVR